MITWKVTTEHTEQAGQAADVPAAWDAVHQAAVDTVTGGVLGTLTLEVDGYTSTIRCAQTGDWRADVRAAVDFITSSADEIRAEANQEH